jgi:transcriptional regulator with XRE-family HTH domain
LKLATSKASKKFGRRVAEYRNGRSMTQEKLAELAGISVDFLSLLERGLRTPSFSTLERLSTALNVSLKDLFDFENKTKN